MKTCFLLLGCLLLPFVLYAQEVRETGASDINTRALDHIFSGSESLYYEIYWTGGVKIGNLRITVQPEAEQDAFKISAKVADHGVFEMFYPINDTFDTYVKGPLKLPYRYEVHQLEGWGDSETRRHTTYEQEKKVVHYTKNKEPMLKFPIEGTVYNEFSAFFISRVLNFAAEDTVVPAFVDKKRHEVMVSVVAREEKETLLGKKKVIKVLPKISFKGLYDKEGDTVFWVTDDDCRVPVEITSKIVIGSLTAKLVDYSNPGCDQVATSE